MSVRRPDDGSAGHQVILDVMNRVLVIAWLLAVSLPAQGPRVKKDLVYKQIGDRRLKLTIYYPEGKGPFATALVIPGGGWRRGSRRSRNAVSLARLLNRDGVACATIDYRHAPRHPHPAQIEDCRRAIQWLRAHASEHDLDPDRVLACGASAGGHLAGLLGAEKDGADPKAKDEVARMSTRPTMVLSFFGPMDLADETAKTNAIGRSLVRSFLGVEKLDESARAKAESASPIHRLAPGAPPFLFIHGSRDPLVPVAQSRVMAEALRRASVPNKLLVVSGSHGDFAYRLSASKPGAEPDYWKQARVFMKRHWRDKKPAVPGASGQ